MEFHRGRLIDHVQLVVSDLGKARDFYGQILSSIGREIVSGEDFFYSDELYVTQIEAGQKLSHIHLAFQVPDRATVEKFYRAAIKAGGKDNGAPGERSYHPGYFAAFVLDADGNNIEAVFHGEATRSADSVVLTPK